MADDTHTKQTPTEIVQTASLSVAGCPSALYSRFNNSQTLPWLKLSDIKQMKGDMPVPLFAVRSGPVYKSGPARSDPRQIGSCSESVSSSVLAVPRPRPLGLTSLADRRLKCDLIEICKIDTGKHRFIWMICSTCQTGYNLREHKCMFATTRSRLQVRHNFFSCEAMANKRPCWI